MFCAGLFSICRSPTFFLGDLDAIEQQVRVQIGGRGAGSPGAASSRNGSTIYAFTNLFNCRAAFTGPEGLEIRSSAHVRPWESPFRAKKELPYCPQENPLSRRQPPSAGTPGAPGLAGCPRSRL